MELFQNHPVRAVMGVSSVANKSIHLAAELREVFPVILHRTSLTNDIGTNPAVKLTNIG